MARIRPFVCYRTPQRPYTRYSKFKRHSYIKAKPANRISRYTSGKQEDFPVKVHLVSKNTLQIRDNALESARLGIVRTMEAVGKTGWFLQMRIYPHHILRENPLAAGAGADRLSTGMKHSFGKPIGIAARVKAGQELFTIMTTKEHIALARRGCKKAAHKLPVQCKVVVEEKAAKKAAAKKAKVERTAEAQAEKAEAPKA